MTSTAMFLNGATRKENAATRGRYTVLLRTDADQAMADAAWLMRTGASTVFQTPEWISHWTRTLGAARSVEFMLLEIRERTSGRLLMLLPLVRRKAGAIRLIETPDFGLADYVGPLVADGFSPGRRAMAGIWAQTRAVLPPADVLRFVKMPGAIAGRENPLLKLDGVRRSGMTAWGVGLSPVGDIWKDSIACCKRRADLDARWRKLSKRGKVEFRTARTSAEIEEFYDAMCAQRAERFALLKFPNALAKPEIRRFYRSLLDGAVGGRPAPAVIQALLVDGEIVATGYGLVGNGAFHMIFPTFKAEKWRNYSPGMHLFRKSMEWSALQGLTYYDFTVGAESFKRDFGAREQALYERYEALSAKGLAAVGWIEAKRLAKKHPGLARFLSRVKSVLKPGGK